MTDDRTGDERLPADLAIGAPFGPGFFLGQLRAFARDRCPNPAEMLPSVEIHLATGEVFDLCHVMGLASGFVALAVREVRGGTNDDGMAMRTEIVPYTFITRVTIRPVSATTPHVGFNPDHAPVFMPQSRSPEAALRAAAAAPDPEPGHGGRD